FGAVGVGLGLVGLVGLGLVGVGFVRFGVVGWTGFGGVGFWGGAAAAAVGTVARGRSEPPLVAAIAIPAITSTATVLAAAIRFRRRVVVTVVSGFWAGVVAAFSPTVGSPGS
ncbi:MAG: hypothetical protein M3Y09_13765, partial [Actinomycetota bacterium]|nr:hypothetical protein [Actinomycetota bacterium]